MNNNLVKTLSTSEDPWELNDAAKALAKGSDPIGHAAVATALVSSHFLTNLDSEEEYAGDSRHLRLASLLKVLAENETQSAHEILLRASESSVFCDNPARIDLMIDALTFIRPAPPRAITFWDKYSQPEDGFVERTIRQISENGSDPAIALLEKKLTSRDFEEEDRAWWIRRHVLGLRDNVTMLNACMRMLQGSLEEALRPGLVEVLFDYQPKAWYRPHDVPAAPDRSNASREALELLYLIGQSAQAELELDPALDFRITDELKTIDETLKDER